MEESTTTEIIDLVKSIPADSTPEAIIMAACIISAAIIIGFILNALFK